MRSHFHDYGNFLKKHLGMRVRKISIDAGFTCPNRDGIKGTGGCTYCSNQSFIPGYCKPVLSITDQLQKGIAFFDKKNRADVYLAYFQSFTNTYASLEKLKNAYEEALKNDRVVGLIISTRPDCVSKEVLNYLENLAQTSFVSVEFGIESCNEKTLAFINRCHTYDVAVDVINRIAGKGIHIGAHLIMGLPYDTYKSCIEHAVRVSELPVDSLKMHHLQILKGTKMAIQYKKQPQLFPLFSQASYFRLMIDIIRKIRPDIYLQRFINRAPADMLIAPKWGGTKNFEFAHLIRKYLIDKNIYQGQDYVRH